MKRAEEDDLKGQKRRRVMGFWAMKSVQIHRTKTKKSSSLPFLGNNNRHGWHVALNHPSVAGYKRQDIYHFLLKTFNVCSAIFPKIF